MIDERTRPEPGLVSRPLEWSPRRVAISKVPYLPGLDGMRALAVVAVMLYHTNNGWLPGGFIGVEVFFVISGYLITLLLIGEHERSGRIDLGQFWLRRARRLLPAVLLTMAALAVYCALFKRSELGNLRGDILAGLAYVSNWYQIWVGQGYTAGSDFAPLRHLWSLAVEEQFYLLWPLAMIALIRLGRRRLPEIALWLVGAAVLIAIVTALLFSGATPDQPAAYWDIGGRQINKTDALYLSTPTRAGGLLLGAACAMLWRPVAVMRGPLRNRGRLFDLAAVVGLAGLGLMAWTLHVTYETGAGDPWLFRGGFLAIGVCTVLVLAAVTHRGALAGRALGTSLLVWIGLRSYGLYLFHWPIYQIIRGEAGAKLTLREFTLAMVLTVAITEVSYRFVETPIRRREIRQWWRHITERSDPRPRQAVVLGATAVVALLGFAAVSLAGGKVRQSDLEASLDDARQQLQSGPTSVAPPTPTAPPTTLTPLPTTTVAVDGAAAATTPPTAAATTAAPTTEAPPANLGTRVAIGDSVLLGAGPTLRDQLGFTVLADESRQFSYYVPMIEEWAANGQLAGVETVVIALGTNGTIDEDDAREVLDLLSGVPRVLLVHNYVDRSWASGNNALMDRLAGEYPNVGPSPLYWDVLAADCETWAAATGLNGNCFYSDGIHLDSAGQRYFVQLIGDTLGL
jgi:peptidoglycan/LPS O-acetylase OafA/YrhL